jgi:hypothetical protein
MRRLPNVALAKLGPLNQLRASVGKPTDDPRSVLSSTIAGLHNDVSTFCGGTADFQQSKRIEHRVRPQVHVALRRREIAMAREFLNRARRCAFHREM